MSFIDANLKHRLDYERMILEEDKKQYTARLRSLWDCKGAVLRRSMHKNGKYYYSVKRRKDTEYNYLGNTNHPEVKRIRETRFLEEMIRRIDHDIGLIDAVSDGFISYDRSSVSESLPSLYRGEVPPVTEKYEYESNKWLTRRLEFQKQHPENYPHKKVHRTSDGVMVKSISELTLYEMFKAAGFAQIYELPLALHDYGPSMYPDFTILSPIDMKTEIIV